MPMFALSKPIDLRACAPSFVLMFVLSACAAPSLLSDSAPDGGPGPVTASGFLEAEQVSVIAEVGGLVKEVRVEEGQPVQAGDIVVVLDDALLQAQRAQAAAAVDVAAANLARLEAGPSDEEVAAAQAALDEAQVGLDAAEYAAANAWAAAADPQAVDVQIAAAQTQADLASRQVELLRVQLQEAEIKLGWLRTVPEAERDNRAIEFQEYNVEILRAQLRAAEAQLAGAQQKLALLQEQREYPISAIAQAHAAQGRIGIAQARLELAQATYDLVSGGPLPEEIAIVQAQVDMAEAQVAFVDAQIAQLTLIAPIGGIVTTRAIHAGEIASPGVPLVTISNLDNLELVVYIPETHIGRVALGAPVDVSVDAYPGSTFDGQITFISDEAEFTPRNVQTEEDRVSLVFAVRIHVDNAQDQLRPGMPADAQVRQVDS